MDTAYAAGAVSKIVKVRGITISTGLPYTSGAYNTSGLTVQYIRDGGTAQTITQVTATAGTYTSSGFVHAGGGVYEIGAPTAALASGADGVVFVVSGVSDVLFSVTRVELMDGDPRAGTVALEDGAITNAKFADNAIDADVLASNTITSAKVADGFITAAKLAADAITAAKLASDVTTEIQSGLATAAALATVAGYIDTEVAAIKAKTDNLPDDPADASVVAGLIAAAEAKIDTVDTVVDAIKAKTDSLTFTQAGHVDANVQRVNDVAITGNGSSPKFGV